MMRGEDDPGAWDNFYSELCTKLARGAAEVWAVRREGALVSTAGAYALSPDTAYLAAVETLEALRGQGIGGWLTGLLAADLAARGRRVALSCKKERLNFYHRLGFAAEDTVQRYALDGLQEEKYRACAAGRKNRAACRRHYDERGQGMIEQFYDLSRPLLDADERALALCREQFARLEEIKEYNQLKMLKAFTDCRVGGSHLVGTTGYGMDDAGRGKLEEVFAVLTGSEAALFRHNFMSGTHTLSVALFGVLRPGDRMVAVTGRPYDTLAGVIGIDGTHYGNLMEFGVQYDEVDLLADGTPDLAGIARKCRGAKMCYIQRSRGYAARPALSLEQIEAVSRAAKAVQPDIIVMVDNCYGEFTQKQEPTQRGADLMAGSLIKNPGGGIAPTGGYIAGRADLVELCAHRLSAPGVGGEIGCTLDMLRGMYLGLYYAPGVVCEALKTSVYAACLFELLGYAATPAYGAQRNDIITSVETGSPEGMVALCGGVQAGSPVDSFAAPEPGDMPGYEDPVIMAAGAFTMGSSIELSADGPLRAPYTVYMQGGLNFAAARAGVLLGADRMLRLRRSE